jgi:hypothetical protein
MTYGMFAVIAWGVPTERERAHPLRSAHRESNLATRENAIGTCVLFSTQCVLLSILGQQERLLSFNLKAFKDAIHRFHDGHGLVERHDRTLGFTGRETARHLSDLIVQTPTSMLELKLLRRPVTIF